MESSTEPRSYAIVVTEIQVLYDAEVPDTLGEGVRPPSPEKVTQEGPEIVICSQVEQQHVQLVADNDERPFVVSERDVTINIEEKHTSEQMEEEQQDVNDSQEDNQVEIQHQQIQHE